MKKSNNTISDWLEKYGDPEIDKQVEEEIKYINKIKKMENKKELLKPDHLGDGVYIHDKGYGIDLAVNHHDNRVISMGEYEIKAFIEYVKRAGYIKED